MENIVNIHDYNTAMQKTLLDKIWFLDKIDNSIKYIFDFGCADGSLTSFINDMFPNHFEFFLIDNNPEMLKITNDNLQGSNSPITFHCCNSIEEAIAQCDDIRKSVLVLNSVIHEIMSYCNEEEKTNLFHKFFYNPFGYIAIRDMHLFNIPHLTINSNDQEVFHKYLDFVSNFTPNGMTMQQMQLEFLLKTDYFNNWEREKKERYLWDWIEIVQGYTMGIYENIWEEDFSLPYHRRKWYKKFGVSQTNKIATHKKLLLKTIDK